MLTFDDPTPHFVNNIAVLYLQIVINYAGSVLHWDNYIMRVVSAVEGK